jgi:hypothetical protein
LNVASKHILSLERAGLVRREQRGREHWLNLDAAPLSEAARFVQRYQRIWEKQLDRLGSYLDALSPSSPAKKRSSPRK